MKRDILYVDDEMDNLVVFEATFEDDFNITPPTAARRRWTSWRTSRSRWSWRTSGCPS